MPSPTVSGRTVVEEPARFVEVQRFVPRPLSLALLVGLAALAVWALAALPVRGPETWLPLALGVGLTLLFHLLELTVTVRRSEIDVRFRPLYRRRIAISDVAACAARTYRPILEYGGWGLRRGWKGGWAFNVRGNRGVQLTLSGGDSILIGSQRAEELARAVRDAAGMPAAEG